MESPDHRPLPASQTHLVQLLDDGRRPLGRRGVALEQLLKHLLRVGVCAEEGLLQHVHVHPLVLGQGGRVAQAKVNEHQVVLGLPAAWPQQHVGGGQVSVDDVLVVHLGQDVAHPLSQALQFGLLAGVRLPARRYVVPHGGGRQDFLQEDTVGGVVHKVHNRGGDA